MRQLADLNSKCKAQLIDVYETVGMAACPKCAELVTIEALESAAPNCTLCASVQADAATPVVLEQPQAKESSAAHCPVIGTARTVEQSWWACRLEYNG